MRTWSGTTPGAVHYYALDLPGNNVNGLFNGSGSVTHRYYYTPWGQAQSTSEASYNPLRYASRELDAATGLYYNRARWYDPYLGRFISEDPIGIDGGINVYAYAGNDPVNFTDPWGLSPCKPGDYNCTNPIQLPTITVRRPRWFRSIVDDQMYLSDRGRGSSIMDAAFSIWHPDESAPELSVCLGGFDDQQCALMDSAFTRLEGHLIGVCRLMGANGRSRHEAGNYRWQPNYPLYGSANLAEGTVRLGPAAFLQQAPGSSNLQLQQTIAEEEAHHAFGGGHAYDRTFRGPLVVAPDFVGVSCREGRVFD